MMKKNNMKNILLLGLSLALSLREVFGDSENEIKRGIFRFMAVVYYPDASIVGSSGTRFSRSAVLIRPDLLISSSLETNDTQLAFPQKTLVARVGAINIDSNFTFNEDEGEQEREIIQIVRPTNFSASQWWNNDITLLKTLKPFAETFAVGSTNLSVKRDYTDKTCYVLVFAKKYNNSTEDKSLMQVAVELLPPSNDNCGVYFRNGTMICASDSDENKNIAYEPGYCYNNDGGPLICEGDVIGLQTYIDYNCKQPHLYQLLSAWDDFISCGVEDKCRISQCANFCTSIDKDDEVITSETNKIITMPTSETSKYFMIDQSTEDSNDEERSMLLDTTISKVKIENEKETPTPTTLSTTEETTTKELTPSAATEIEEQSTRITEDQQSSWPKEKNLGHRKKLDESDITENIDRTANVEAQRQETKKKGRNAAESSLNRKMSIVHSLFFGLLFF